MQTLDKPLNKPQHKFTNETAGNNVVNFERNTSIIDLQKIVAEIQLPEFKAPARSTINGGPNVYNLVKQDQFKLEVRALLSRYNLEAYYAAYSLQEYTKYVPLLINGDIVPTKNELLVFIQYLQSQHKYYMAEPYDKYSEASTYYRGECVQDMFNLYKILSTLPSDQIASVEAA